MRKSVEISSFDLRYESCRMKCPNAEKVLLSSIAEKGIRESLQGVDRGESRILLDGFKRYRCARKLGIGIVPYSSLGSDEALGIVELLRISNARSLTIVEQARLIHELKTVHKMCVSEIAGLLEKSKSWVSMRWGIIGEMSECVRNRIFSGKFPIYSYMYTLRQFMRMNKIPKKDIDDFVTAVSGKGLSIRDIETLAHGYFRGSKEFREQVKSGDISWGLSRIREARSNSSGCTELECGMLRDLEITQKYMQRVIYKSRNSRFKTDSFYVQANLLAGGILRQMDTFQGAVKEFYDRKGQTQSNLLSL